MKKKFLFLLLLFWVASNLSYAQDEDIYGKNSYIPVFADADTTNWFIAWTGWGGVYEIDLEEEATLFSNGYYYRVASGYFATLAVREDTIEQKIYRFSPDGEFIFYDFTLEVGDTAHLYGGTLGKVLQTEYLLISGKYRKVIYIQYNVIWIEGIGSLAGFDRPNMGASFNSFSEIALTCYFKDNVKQYEHKLTPNHDCYWTGIPIGIDEKKQNFEVSLIPNPVTNVSELHFMNPECKTVKLQIYNLQGLIVYTQTTQSDNFKIASENYVSGLYLYCLIFEDGNIVSGKFIVE